MGIYLITPNGGCDLDVFLMVSFCALYHGDSSLNYHQFGEYVFQASKKQI